MRAFSDYIRQIPIPIATPAQRDEIEVLVQQVLVAQAAGRAQEVKQLDAEIDARVYRLYDLKEEIAIVEGR